MPSETDVAASAISGRTDGHIGWSPSGLKYRAAYAANNTKMTDEIQDIYMIKDKFSEICYLQNKSYHINIFVYYISYELTFHIKR